jgi:hypothetical protein
MPQRMESGELFHFTAAGAEERQSSMWRCFGVGVRLDVYQKGEVKRRDGRRDGLTFYKMRRLPSSDK